MVVLDNSSTICNTSNEDQKEEDDILTTSTSYNTTNTDSYNTSSNRVSYKDLLIDTNLRKVFVKNKVIKLTSIDYKILE
ncbi:MAG: hypothetical protein LBI63_03770, partial [Candidatus Ancillula sp.]|nr:hypothetical protein [Candidatus Ancillula sp.]